MNIEYLRNFVKLANYKSFSELAHDIPISQSTLSHQISQLENFFGPVLINRSTKKFEITEAGIIFLDHAKRIIDLFDSCVKEMSKFRDITYEDIVISTSTTPGSHLLPGEIAEYRDKNPNINFSIMINNSRKSIENVVKHIADFAGIGSFLNYNKENFDFIKIGEDQLKFICSPNHQLLKDTNGLVNFTDLVKFPFVWREKGSGMRNAFKEQFPEYKKLKKPLEMNDNDSIISAVSESNYISIMSEIMAKNAEKAGLIKILEIRDHEILVKRDLYFIKPKGKELSKLKMDFWVYVKNKAKQRE
ncbi:MAG: LysR family transcriptional regulator [Candidatus Lokiarchaeota archaeon]|nr:LysR family transcriptional regulator [Candidatus Lokiarchaeota archaeon]